MSSKHRVPLNVLGARFRKGRCANSRSWAGGSRTPRGVRGQASRLTCQRGALVSFFPILERAPCRLGRFGT